MQFENSNNPLHLQSDHLVAHVLVVVQRLFDQQLLLGDPSAHLIEVRFEFVASENVRSFNNNNKRDLFRFLSVKNSKAKQKLNKNPLLRDSVQVSFALSEPSVCIDEFLKVDF